jgi:hypothetical protein
MCIEVLLQLVEFVFQTLDLPIEVGLGRQGTLQDKGSNQQAEPKPPSEGMREDRPNGFHVATLSASAGMANENPPPDQSPTLTPGRSSIATSDP